MMSKPTILFIAGGNNSRFFPLNTVTHKGFIELGGKPLIVKAIENAQSHGFEKFVIVISKREAESEDIKTVLTDAGFAAAVTLVTQQEAKGMADAVLTAKDYLGDFFVLASPYYTNTGDIAEQFWKKHQETNADCVFLASETDTPSLYGILEVADNRVVSIVEKPAAGTEPSNLKVNSIYLLNQKFLETLANTPADEYALETAFATFAGTHHISYITSTEKLPSLKYAWHLFGMFEYLMNHQETKISPEAKIAETAVIDDSKGPVIIEAGATVGHAARVVGPCYLGNNTLLGDFSFLRGSSIEEGGVVGANTEVVRGLILKRASIHYGYLADSILGPGTKVGAGLITANKRLDRKNIHTILKDKKVDTGTNTFGLITGEKANLGIRVNTMPGVLIGANSIIYPAKTLTKNVEHGDFIK